MDRARPKVNAYLSFFEFLSAEAAASAASPEKAKEAESCAIWIQGTEAAFRAALDDDLNYAKAFEAVVTKVQDLEPEKVGSTTQALEAMKRWDRVLGILG